MPSIVIKRDGESRQSFDILKIQSAVRAAWNEVREPDDKSIAKIAARVAENLSDEVGVEEIQDAVEVALMRAHRHDVARAFILFRQHRAELRGQRTEPDPTAISQYIHASKYARHREDLHRREVHAETVERVEGMHLRRFANVDGLEPLIREAFDAVRRREVLPSMRSMQFGGPAVEANHLRQYNCSATLIDRPRVFAELLYLLLCGCGTGYSIQFEHVENLPEVAFIDPKAIVHHVVGDSIEGWADALDALVRSYLVADSAEHGRYVEFAFHEVRDAGSPLKTSGGKAPGHRKLKESLERIREVFDGAQGRQLRPIECHRINCHSAAAVLSGGIRRSAMICLFSPDDGEMMNAKADASWFDREPWFQYANNSAVLVRDQATRRQFHRVMQLTRKYGDPGAFWVTCQDHATNPCQPAWATVLTPGGIRTIGDIKIGDQIWSGKQWTTVTNKWSTGVKPVKAYRTRAGTFYGTENHRVVENGIKVEVQYAKSIDSANAPDVTHEIIDVQDVSTEEVFDLTVDADEHTYWTDGLLVSNCSEIGLDPILRHADGSRETGWAFCNLTTINAAKLTSRDDFLRAARAAALIGTLQASYTDFPYLGPVSETIARRDALIGVSMTSIQDAPNIALDPDIQREVAESIKAWNAEFAAMIGINAAARTTTVKPEGTGTMVFGTGASGIHPHHARRYIRRVTADDLETVFQAFRKVNPTMCVRKPDGKWVVEFPIEAPDGARLREDFDAISFLECVRSTQQNWVIPGTVRESAVPGLRHNVSNTVTICPHEWDDVEEYLWQHRDEFTGVSFLPDTGDTNFAFAPFEAVVTEAQEARWRELVASYRPVDYLAIREDEDTTAVALEPACAGGACEWAPGT